MEVVDTLVESDTLKVCFSRGKASGLALSHVCDVGEVLKCPDDFVSDLFVVSCNLTQS